MNKLLSSWVFFLLLGILTTIKSYGQSPGLGDQVAKDIMALVGYVELSNIGARDPECKGTPFESNSINVLIDTEVVGYLNRLAAMENIKNKKEIDDTLKLIRQIPIQKNNGRLVMETVYDQKKQEAKVTYGEKSGCSAISAMFRTVVQQRRLSLRALLK